MRKAALRTQWRLTTAAALLIVGASAGCTDHPGMIEAPLDGPRLSGHTQPAEWKGFWKKDLELWVYDMTPEIGLNSSAGGGPHHQRIRDAGMRLMRHGFLWYQWVEGSAGNARYELRDGALADGRQRGIEYMLVIAGPRDTAVMQKTNPYTAAERDAVYQAYANDLVWMVENYEGVKFYQLFNETDAGCENGKFFNGLSAVGTSQYANPNRYVQGYNYADMLKVVYPAMKAAAQREGREVWIVVAGLTGNEALDPNNYCVPDYSVLSWDFLRGMYANGAQAYFDILALHAYGATATSTHSLFERSHVFNYQVHAVVNDPNRPIWVTEFGSSAQTSEPLLSPNRDQSQDGAVLDEIQRQWYQDAISVQVQGQHLQKIFGYTYATTEGGQMNIASPINSGSPWDYSLGIFREDHLTGRPSYNWLLGRAGINATAENYGTRTGTFRIFTNGQVPVHHPYYHDGTGAIVIQNIQVNSLYPTVIPMMWPGPGDPGDPGDPGTCDPYIICPGDPL